MMSISRIRPNWIVGSLFALTFAILLILRLGIFQKVEENNQVDRALDVRTRMDRETWMNIYQQEQKVGYAHRQFFKTVEGYRVLESVFMQVNTMGMVQDIRFKTEGNLRPDLTLSSFLFELQSSLFHFKARGVLDGKILTLFTGMPGAEHKIDLPFEREVHLPIGILEALNGENLKPGESRTFYVFDPATVAERPVKVVAAGEETIPVMGRQEKAKKVSVDFMGAPQFAWIGKDGTVLKEEGSLGLKLEQVTKEEALNKVTLSPGADLTEIASIPANKIIQEAQQIKELRLRLDGIDTGSLFLSGGRQSLLDNVLTIRKESLASLPLRGSGQKVFEEGKTYLESTPFIQADHPEIRAKVKEIVSAEEPDVVKAKKLVAWVKKSIQKRPVLSVPNALETLHNRVGDCNEHAVLLAALARAAGIPAQVEAGLVYQRGRFYYHAWNVLYLGTWITADSVMGQLPADVTHIRFVRGTEEQIDLLRIIGRVKLEILSVS
jgi:hypothetical protein